VFHTNYESRKGRELAFDPYAALLFYWDKLERQVRIEGSVAMLPAAESDAYFASRPRGNGLSAWASIKAASFPIAPRSRRAWKKPIGASPAPQRRRVRRTGAGIASPPTASSFGKAAPIVSTTVCHTAAPAPLAARTPRAVTSRGALRRR